MFYPSFNYPYPSVSQTHIEKETKELGKVRYQNAFVIVFYSNN